MKVGMMKNLLRGCFILDGVAPQPIFSFFDGTNELAHDGAIYIDRTDYPALADASMHDAEKSNAAALKKNARGLNTMRRRKRTRLTFLDICCLRRQRVPQRLWSRMKRMQVQKRH